jgi:CheY-like chemotaxis protein
MRIADRTTLKKPERRLERVRTVGAANRYVVPSGTTVPGCGTSFGHARLGKRGAVMAGDEVHVLVLDDEPTVGKRLSVVLSKIGCRVEAFSDPHAALARIDEKEFDVVITDVVMGDVDGLQVLDRVQQHSPRTRVIIITAYAMMAMARKAMDKGAFDFVAKPFVPSEIRDVVERAVGALGLQLPDA